MSKSLVCDGVLNCDIGDDSDEKNCELSYLKSRNYLLAMFVSFLVFVLVTCLYCMLRCKRRRKSTLEKSNAQRIKGIFIRRDFNTLIKGLNAFLRV